MCKELSFKKVVQKPFIQGLIVLESGKGYSVSGCTSRFMEGTVVDWVLFSMQVVATKYFKQEMTFHFY